MLSVYIRTLRTKTSVPIFKFFVNRNIPVTPIFYKKVNFFYRKSETKSILSKQNRKKDGNLPKFCRKSSKIVEIKNELIIVHIS